MSFNLQSLKQRAQTRVFSELRKASGYTITAENLILENNRQRLFESISLGVDTFDIFLSHSFKDAEVILGILEKLNNLGYSVYIDWITDSHFDRANVNKVTINTIKGRMIQSNCLLYATTENSTQSKWMPWELGYMDGRKDRAAILPIFQSENSSSYTYNGQEYLGAYPYCIQTTPQGYPDREGLWIFEDSDTYTTFDSWIKGAKPIKKVG